jgi:hypothetical protein
MNKYIPTLIFSLLVSSVSLAQFSVNGSNGQGGTIEAYDPTGKPMTISESGRIEGNPFLCPDWCSGSVLFANGKTANLPLRFDLQKNKLYFQQDGKFYEFVDDVTAFQMKIQGTDSALHVWKFRKGYDPRAGKKGDAYYQVIEEGPRAHMIYHTYAGLVDSYKYGGPEKQTFQMKQELYLFDPLAGSLSKVRLSAHDVQSALPSSKDEVRDWFTQHPGDLDRPGLAKLVHSLNATAH